MAMGDNVRSRNRIDYNDQRGQQIYKNTADYIQGQGSQFGADYNAAKASDDQMRGAAFSGFQDFAKTGGFSPMDKAAMRARGNSPIRATYANAQRNIGRQQAMGGTSAGRNVLQARMAREQGQAASDATTNTEAGIAKMVQEGRLEGNKGITQLYGTTPANSAMQSRNVLTNTQQGLDLTQMENQRMQGIMQNQIAASQLPGKGESILNNVLKGSQVARNIFGDKGFQFPGSGSPYMRGGDPGTLTLGDPNYRSPTGRDPSQPPYSAPQPGLAGGNAPRPLTPNTGATETFNIPGYGDPFAGYNYPTTPEYDNGGGGYNPLDYGNSGQYPSYSGESYSGGGNSNYYGGQPGQPDYYNQNPPGYDPNLYQEQPPSYSGAPSNDQDEWYRQYDPNYQYNPGG